ncbi:hypothetical protein BCV70DRAFT_198497 [Testicularia cyperi]|uniref:Transcription factor IIIC 90kDa subunit N-terminal domain-containing protein n=1 Tax=Testicularia cyperi TaxID=1882483 RepID=A0A317XWL4_9BASI|nr:hypothetical protein BCV70DRAFT_198497 [Testicularia cyperi]
MVSDGSRTLVASVPLAGCASNYGNLQWSELGQALVVTQESLFVLSPIFALHAKLATSHALCDVECHPSWSGRFPHTCCQISAKTLLENDPTERERIAIEVDYTQVHPLFASPRWKDASWSKPGMGPHGSCLILAISSELDLLVIGAPKNSWTGDWTLLHAVDFSPVAQQVSLNLLGGSADKLHDAPRMAFSRSRALKRKRQSAAEVLCATWADAPQMPRRSLVTRRDGTDPLHGSFAFVIAGTRSGHIAVWECHAGTGRCFLASVSSVSSSPVEQLLLGTSPGVCEDGAQGRLVFQDSQGLRLCNFYAMEDHALAELCNSQPSRLSQLGFRMVSNWKWFEHQLVFTTVGRAHVYDFRTDSITTYLFTVGTAETDADPYLPAISISAEVHAQSFTVVLQDLHHYHLLAIDGGDDGNNQDIRVAAQSPDELLGYPPLVADLQSQHDSLQAYHGLEFEPASTRESPHRMQASTLMDEHAAFLGFKVSETSKFHLMLIKNGATEIQALVASALKSAGVGVGSGRPPVTSIHALIASVLVAEDRKTALCELDFAVKKEAERIAAHNSDGKDDGGALAADRQLMLRAQNQALFCIYAWLQVGSDRILDSEVDQRGQVLLTSWLESVSW